MTNYTGLEIAIIGMAGRFPGATSINEFWEKLDNGEESIHFFSPEELKELNITEDTSGNPQFVNALGKVDGIRYFDPEFFGFTHNEAEKLSPQTRLLFECTWECLEDAGYANVSASNQIGVYYGANSQLYWEAISRITNTEINPFELQFLSEKDYISTLIAHKLNLGGPAITLQTACSTSLVAVHTASRALLTGDCELALAGGVHLNLEVQGGYLYEEGMINSSDGHCRTFDAKADGTVGGNGGAVVLLKLLKKAIADKDHIYGIIKGSAINNDGKQKVAFSAPSVKGQRDVIRKALKVSKVDPSTIRFIEAHGTATKLGDPVEVDALKQAFGDLAPNQCALGSVKSNIGHLGAAAGVAGLIKATLALKNKVLPASLHYTSPNPKLGLENSPFFVNNTRLEFNHSDVPLRGGISSFGIGGTNAHVIVEEAPKQIQTTFTSSSQVFTLSAHSQNALKEHLDQFKSILPEASFDLHELCYTLQTGRKSLTYRKAIVVDSIHQLHEALSEASNLIENTIRISEDNQVVLFVPSLENEAAWKSCFETTPLLQKHLHGLVETYGISESTIQKVTAPDAKMSTTSGLLLQLALIEALTELGIKPSLIVAEGKGQLAAITAAKLTTYTDIASLLESEEPTGSITLTGKAKYQLILEDYEHTIHPSEELHSVNLAFKGENGNRNALSEILQVQQQNTLIIGFTEKPTDGVLPLFSAEATPQHAILPVLAELWEKGVSINWDCLHTEKPYKISIPTLPFQRKEYWLKHTLEDLISGAENTNSVKLPNDQRMLDVNWKRIRSVKKSIASEPKKFLLIGKAISAFSEQLPGTSVCVNHGSLFERTASDNIQLRMDEAEDYQLLFQHLSETDQFPDTIIYAPEKNTSGIQTDEFYQCLHLFQAYYKTNTTEKVRFVLLSNNVFDVLGSETILQEKSLALGPVIVANQEFPFMTAHLIDVDKLTDQSLNVLLHYIRTEQLPMVGALRHNQLWERSFTPVEQTTSPSIGIIENGVYVITGGRGMLGKNVARYLAQKKNVNIYLLGRTNTNSEIEQAFEREIEASGSQLFYRMCDVSDQQQLIVVLNEIQETHGKINGIIHGAAVLNNHVKQLEVLTFEEVERQFEPKVKGTQNLMLFVENNPVDFVICMSSIASVLGGIGFTAYAAANAYQDAIVQKNQYNDSTNWISVNWDAWYVPEMETTPMGRELAQTAITFEDGRLLFDSLTSLESRQVIVSMTDFQKRLKNWTTTESENTSEASNTTTITYFERGDLKTAYIGPENKLEAEIAKIWQDFFRIKQIGTEDDFYELGGDSLKGMALIKQYSALLHENVDISVVFDAYTIKETVDLLMQDHPESCERIINEKQNTVELPESIAPEELQSLISPLSSQQKRLYFLQLIQENNINYNLPRIIHLPEQLEHSTLQQAFNQLIERHEALRTSFHIADDVPMQEVHPEIRVEIERCETQMTQSEARKLLTQPFDLEKAPLVRLVEFRTPDNERFLFHDIHHIITDGTSKEIMEKELDVLLSGGSLSPVKAQYRAYAENQQSALYLKKLEEDKAYWLNEFPEEPSAMNLPLDFARTFVPKFEGGELSFFIDEQTTNQLRNFCKDNHCTSFVALLAALKLTLYKLSGASDIVIGTPVEGRMDDRFSDTIGLFVNTLAIRTQPSDEKQSILEFTDHVKSKVVKSLVHQELPFDDIIDHLGINRIMGRNPLFDVMFNLQSYKHITITEEPKEMYTGDGIARFDLNFRGIEMANGIHFKISYARHLFQQVSVERLTKLYKGVIQQLVENPSLAISQLVPDNSLQNEILQLNPAQTPVTEETISDWLQRTVEQFPQHTAVVSGKDQLTYEELNARVTEMAARIQQQELPLGSLVAVIMTPGIDLAISILAIIKSGNAFLPIDSETPIERIGYMINDGNVQLVISNVTSAEQYKSDKLTFLTVDGNTTSDQLSFTAPKTTWNQTLYTIYTSGTTGQPKGVAISHKNAVNYLNWTISETGISEKDQFLLINNFAFDAVYTVFFGALLSGGTLHLMDKDQYLSPDVVTRYVQENQITYLKFTPSMGNLLLQHDEFGNRMKSLRFLMIGGEKIRINDAIRFQELLPETTIMNHYGPTETTIGSVAKKIEKEDWKEFISQPTVGKPISNTQLYILDEHKQLVPHGSIGELYIGGFGVSRGYIGAASAQNDAFVPNPFEEGLMVYRTGDLARWTAQGELIIVGRKDDQVKINGFRIQLSEVEKVLTSHPDIVQSLALDVSTDGENKLLVAYIICNNKLTLGEIRNHLNQSIPAYMIPSYIVVTDQFPLNKNGKIAVERLPDYKEHVLSSGNSFVAPTTEHEITIHNVWVEVLGNHSIGIEANFFEIGGNSIKLVQLASKINRIYERNELITTFFQHPNIKEQASFFGANNTNNNQESTSTISASVKDFDDVLNIIND